MSNETVGTAIPAPQTSSQYPQSPEEAVQKWDAGDILWTIEMGGLGPGYEQAIQVLMVEILRAATKRQTAAPWTEEMWQSLTDEVVKEHDESLGGLSGAQVGCARWLAWQFYFNGWDATKKAVEEKGENDRWTMVSNHWPRAKQAA